MQEESERLKGKDCRHRREREIEREREGQGEGGGEKYRDRERRTMREGYVSEKKTKVLQRPWQHACCYKVIMMGQK